MTNPDDLLTQVTNATTVDEYQNTLQTIRSWDTGSSPEHDGRTSTDLIDEAETKLEDEIDGWNEASISELLKEAIVRASN